MARHVPFVPRGRRGRSHWSGWFRLAHVYLAVRALRRARRRLSAAIDRADFDAIVLAVKEVEAAAERLMGSVVS